MQYLLYSILLTHILVSSITTDFCRLQCGKDHVVCQRKPCGPDKMKCGTQFEMFPLNSHEREIVTYMHNSFRDKIARQYIDLPYASDMKVMSYSRELEFVAQCYANSCPKRIIKTNKNICRSTTGFLDVGQNVYILHKDMGFYTETKILTLVLNYWQKQIAFVKKEWINSIDLELVSSAVEVLQMIWADTLYVGCGRARYGGYIITKFVVVCNYAPAGLIDGGEVYFRAESCAHCPDNCNNQHMNLCGEERPLFKDFWNSPFPMNSLCDKLGCAFYVNILILFLLIIIYYYY